MKNLKKIVGVVILVAGMIIPCFSADVYKPCSYLFIGDGKTPDFRDIVYSGQEKTVRAITRHFCSSVINSKCSDDVVLGYSTDYFDANQSIFLSILCESVGHEYGTYYSDTLSSLKKQSFLDFGIVSSVTGYTESCHSYGTMNDCDYSYYLPKIFNEIMNDYFNIRQARFYGVSKLEDQFDIEDYANAFSSGNFPTLGGICDSKNSKGYYKSTCKTLKNYMKDAVNLLKKTEVVDVKLLQGREPDCNGYPDKDILYCGLLGDDSINMFINSVYNEYFRYNIFMSYYSYYLSLPDYSVRGNGSLAKKYEDDSEAITLIQDQIKKSKEAITLSFRKFAEISDSFPLHIGLLMYQEDAKLFMKEMGKVYSPMRTLYDKLRNVQIKE